jgi:SEC-C motif-containing protein
MRSRFTAFALGRTDYLLTSWHPSTRPASLDPDPETEWRRLQLVDVVEGGPDDTEGVVEFRASYRSAASRATGGAGLLHERSRFVRFDGRWVYLDGDQLD